MSARYRWTVGARKRPAEGDTRVISRLLLLPYRIGNEYRWCGVERINQEARLKTFFVMDSRLPRKRMVWEDKSWADADPPK